MGSALRGLDDSFDARLAARSDQRLVEAFVEATLQAPVVVESRHKDAVLVQVLQGEAHARHKAVAVGAHG